MAKKRRRVLIVDDEQVVCDFLSDGLTEKGYLCTSAANAEEALFYLTQRRFDVVLLDIRLPEISGIEILQQIQSKWSDTLTIMITAVNDVDTAVETMKLGACDYIVKPFDIDRVRASIRAVLKARESSERFSQMDAISRGVDAKLDPACAYSRTVTEETAIAARYLRVPNQEIRRWVEERETRNEGKKRLARLLWEDMG